MLFTDLRELKSMLEIDPEDRSEDVRLNHWIRLGCEVLESYLGWSPFRMERTEYPKPSGKLSLVLDARPVYISPAPRIWVDESANFGLGTNDFAATTELTFGVDFTLDMKDAVKSTSGILYGRNRLWNKKGVRVAGLLSPYIEEARGTIKVVYTGGFAVEDLPGEMVTAAVMAISKIRFMMPLGLPVQGDSFMGRSISLSPTQRNDVIGHVKPLIFKWRNRRF